MVAATPKMGDEALMLDFDDYVSHPVALQGLTLLALFAAENKTIEFVHTAYLLASYLASAPDGGQPTAESPFSEFERALPDFAPPLLRAAAKNQSDIEKPVVCFACRKRYTADEYEVVSARPDETTYRLSSVSASGDGDGDSASASRYRLHAVSTQQPADNHCPICGSRTP